MPTNRGTNAPKSTPDTEEPAAAERGKGKSSSRRMLVVGASVFAVIALLLVVAKLLLMRSSRHLVPREGLVCLLVNKNSGRCLSVAGEDAKAGAKIVQGPMPDKARASERWILLKAETGFRLKNEHSQMVLEIPGKNTGKGVGAIQWYDGVSSSNQHWEFEEVGPLYILKASHSQLVLAVGQGLKEEGAAAVQWEFVPDVADQLWDLRSAIPD